MDALGVVCEYLSVRAGPRRVHPMVITLAGLNREGYSVALRLVRDRLMPPALPWDAFDSETLNAGSWSCQHAKAYLEFRRCLRDGSYDEAASLYKTREMDCGYDECYRYFEFPCDVCGVDLVLGGVLPCAQHPHPDFQPFDGAFLKAAALWSMLLHGVLVPELFGRVMRMVTMPHDGNMPDWTLMPGMAEVALGLPERTGTPEAEAAALLQPLCLQAFEPYLDQMSGEQDNIGTSISHVCVDLSGFHFDTDFFVGIYRALADCPGAQAALLGAARQRVAELDHDCMLCTDGIHHDVPDECQMDVYAEDGERLLAELIALLHV